jgi:hypothetical protein
VEDVLSLPRRRKRFAMQFKLEEGVEVLAQTPAVLDALLRGKSQVWLTARRGQNAFSAVDVLGHLIFGEMTDWIPRVRLILDRGESVLFEPFDRFGFETLAAGKTVGDLLDEFARQRSLGLQTLRDLKLDDVQLAYRGKHPELGTVTIRELLAAWVVHDLGHIDQIVKTMAAEYREAVGPWLAYTSILH